MMKAILHKILRLKPRPQPETSPELLQLRAKLQSLNVSTARVVEQWTNSLPKPSANPANAAQTNAHEKAQAKKFPWRAWAAQPIRHLWKKARPHCLRILFRICRPLTKRLQKRLLNSVLD